MVNIATRYMDVAAGKLGVLEILSRVASLTIMTTAFSTSEQDAITRIIHVQQDLSSKHEFVEFYEIQRTVDEIFTGDYKRVKSLPNISLSIFHLFLFFIS